MLSRSLLLTSSSSALRVAALLALLLTLLTHNGGHDWSLFQATRVTGQGVTTNCQSIQVPTVTHGFQKTDNLPSGDHFLLADPFAFGVTTPAPVGGSIPGLQTFTINPTSFGGDVLSVGGLRGTNPTGVGYSTAGGRLTLLSCTDSIWDGSFFIASKGTTVGDVIRFFVQRPDGSGAFTLFSFTVEANGVRLTEINEHGALYQGSRLAMAGRFFEGEFLPFVADAGAAGRRTNLLTFGFDMEPNSPLNECLQLGVTLTRGNGTGTISLLVTDVIVNRNETTGDAGRTTPGLIGGLTSGYPTGRECQVFCAVCEPVLPSIACPLPVSTCVAAGATSAVVTYPVPAAPGVTVTCTPASGSSFPLGVTAVTCTASNAGGQSSCSFAVTVNDAPALTCPANITTGATSASGAVVNFTTPAGSGRGTTVLCNRASGSTFQVGTTTVTCTATNTCGTQSCTFTVTVVDPPTIMCADNIKVTATSDSGAVVTYPAPKVTGTGAVVTCDRASGSTFPLGTTTVKCTVTSPFGMAMCSFTVTVEQPLKCDTFCFRSPAYWANRSRSWARGSVFISGVNFNQGVSTRDTDSVMLALRGNTPVAYGPLSPQEWFNQEYVTAQLNLLAASNSGSVSSINMLWSNLGCYGLSFPPLTLSNGAVLSPSAMMKDLFMQAQQAAGRGNAADFNALANLFNSLNGDDPQGNCH